MIEVEKANKEWELCNACMRKATKRVSIFYGTHGSMFKLCDECAEELRRKLTEVSDGNDL